MMYDGGGYSDMDNIPKRGNGSPGQPMNIVPRTRLLLFTAVTLFPAAILAAAIPEAIYIFGSFAGLLITIAVFDALHVLGKLKDIELDCPETVRISKGKPTALTIKIHNEHPHLNRLKVGLALPRQLQATATEIIIALPPKTPWASFSWPFRAMKQGRYVLEKIHLEAVSSLGFWGKRTTIAVHTEIRVYPNLLSEGKDLAALFTRKQLGVHSQRQLGKGREFEQLREYIPGDSYEDIHWKATARRGTVVTKIFQIERTQEMYVILDASRLSTRYVTDVKKIEDWTVPKGVETIDDQVHPETIFERFATAALIVGMAAERQSDRFGLITFSDQPHGFLRARNGKAHFDACRDMLFTMEPQNVTPDFSELFTFIGTHLRKRALLFFLTNLDDPVLAEHFIRNIDMMTRHHLVMVNMINHTGAKPLFSSGPVETADDLYTALGEHLIWDSLRETGKKLRKRKADFSLLENEKLSGHLISQYFNVKQRQLLCLLI